VTSRHSNDGLYKRCDCARRQWLKCAHGWHFDFYKGRKWRYSLDVIARARGEQPPRAKGDAEALRDRIRGEIRSGTFTDPHAQPAPVPADARLTFADVADRYRDRYVRVPTRRKMAGHAIELHLEALKRAEIPAARGHSVRLADKPIAEITKADIEAIRDGRRQAMRRAVEARVQWDAEAAARTTGETMARPKPREMAKGGETGINRLLARLRALLNWAIAEGYIDSNPFKRHGVTVIKLAGRAEQRRRRRVQGGEEQGLITHASPHLQALIIAALETGCRVGELLALQWRDIEQSSGPTGEPVPRRIVLPAEKTKDNETREIPVTQRLAAILEMRRVAPDGRPLSPAAHVFGNETGEPIASIKTAWKATCRRANIAGLHFHDLRREFASRVRETPGNSDHEVRDLLGHANISTTSRYLGSTPETRERAMHRFEQHQNAN
jgi:integrase